MRHLKSTLRNRPEVLALVLVAVVLASAALVGWPATEPDRMPEGSPGMDAGETRSQRLSAASASRSPSDAPRTRLEPGHTPAAGPSIARIDIPSIGVSAPVIELGLNRDKTLQVPARASETGWWSGGAFPGERGAAVIAGHVDSRTGPAVFFRLGELDPGDRISVTEPDGRSARFVVDRKVEYDKDRFRTAEVYGRTAEPALRLVTCSGPFDEASGHYESNLVVFARGV